jgi:hypothetical protein
MKTSLVLLTSLIVCVGSLHAQITLEETEVDTATVIAGLDVPWEMIYGPDNFLWGHRTVWKGEPNSTRNRNANNNFGYYFNCISKR